MVNRKWIEISANILFWMVTSWIVLSYLSIEKLELEMINGRETLRITRSRSLSNLFAFGQVLAVIFFYVHLFAIRNLARQKNIQFILLISLGMFAFVLTIHFLLSQLLLSPIKAPYPPLAAGVFTFYYAVSTGYAFTKVWIRNENDKKELELVKNQAELKLLRSQLHPHFLFNTLNNLLAMIDQRQNPVLAESIDKLSALLRYVVYDSKNAKVTVAKEIEFIRTFAQLNLLRFEEDEIDFQLNLRGDLDQQWIEPGIFLCFVENAFKHGVRPEMHSYIHIDLDLSHPNLIAFSIKNPMPKALVQRKRGGQGLKSTIKWLQLVYPGRHELEIDAGRDSYTVHLKIYGYESDHSR